MNKMIMATLGSLLLLAGCVTVPQSDLTEAVKASLQPAVDTFFEELDKELKPDAELTETGYLTVDSPDPGVMPPDWVLYYHGRPPAEPAQDDPPEEWEDWEIATAVWEAVQETTIAAWRLSQTYRSYVDWGFWSTLDGEPLFKIALSGDSAPEDQTCFDTPSFAADCGVLPHRIDSAASGTPTGVNPIAGAATWSGYARAVSRNGKPVVGEANLEADLGAGLIDVHLTDLGACAVGKLTTICSSIRSFVPTTYGV